MSSTDQNVSAWLRKTYGIEFLTDLARDGAKAALGAGVVILAGLIARADDWSLMWLAVFIGLVPSAAAGTKLYREARATNQPMSTWKAVLFSFLCLCAILLIVLLVTLAIITLFSKP